MSIKVREFILSDGKNGQEIIDYFESKYPDCNYLFSWKAYTINAMSSMTFASYGWHLNRSGYLDYFLLASYKTM